MGTALSEKLQPLFDKSPRPPGPRGWDAVTAQLEFSKDQIGFFRKVHRTYGDVSSFKLGSFDIWLICDPELIEGLLLRQHDKLEKDELTHELDELLGQGLLTSEGDFWKRQRKLASPALRRRQIESYAESMVRLTHNMLDDWDDGQTVDFHQQMMQLTLRIVVKTLFNLEVGHDVDKVESALEDAMHFFHVMAHTLWRFLPEFLPTPSKFKFQNAIKQLDQTIYDLIAQRKADGKPGDDLLWALLSAVDDEGSSMTDQQLRDECITIFLAGHETTALTLSYTWWILTHHPEIFEKLQTEVDDVLGGERPVADDVKRLPYTMALIKESMRVYPPAWIIGREPIEPIELGEWTIPVGAQVLFPQSVVHMDRRWYESPEEIRPERWLDGTLEDRLGRFGYFPFGGGTRVCIGNHFAMMEIALVLVTMVQRVTLENLTTEPMVTQPSVTLRPLTTIHMKPTARPSD